ncbi:hypothetical protein NPIL_180541 [Nephila pilipes]|uniref:Uncharacterized protein n=1 Tax=Nephila pilipes TaxID=299642 RepID=A0A8X6N3C5_NEPPI|nr:hypothetical protein NPIL_180541 [Nephila pilipes]
MERNPKGTVGNTRVHCVLGMLSLQVFAAFNVWCHLSINPLQVGLWGVGRFRLILKRSVSSVKRFDSNCDPWPVITEVIPKWEIQPLYTAEVTVPA